MLGNLLSARRGATLYLLVWLLLGGMLGVVISVAEGISWANGLLFSVQAMTIYALETGYSVYYLCRAYPLAKRRPDRVVFVFISTAVISSVIWVTGVHLLNAAWKLLEVAWAGIELSRGTSAVLFVFGVALYGLAAVGHYLLIEFECSQEAQRYGLEMKLLAQDAELRMLRMQIDPHFLFNSLNSISAMTTRNPSGARQMTLQLAGFLRQSLGHCAYEKISLRNEIQLALDYLTIEKIRLGSRLNVLESIDPTTTDCLVPPLIVQPLIENAVKHGIGDLLAGGEIHVSTKRMGSSLCVAIENDVDCDTPAASGRGIGLVNVRHRLAATYGNEASLHWARQGNKFRVQISIPIENSKDA